MFVDNDDNVTCVMGGMTKSDAATPLDNRREVWYTDGVPMAKQNATRQEVAPYNMTTEIPWVEVLRSARDFVFKNFEQDTIWSVTGSRLDGSWQT